LINEDNIFSSTGRGRQSRPSLPSSQFAYPELHTFYHILILLVVSGSLGTAVDMEIHE